MQVADRFSNSATSQNLNQSQMIALLSLPDAEETEKFIAEKAAEGQEIENQLGRRNLTFQPFVSKSRYSLNNLSLKKLKNEWKKAIINTRALRTNVLSPLRKRKIKLTGRIKPIISWRKWRGSPINPFSGIKKFCKMPTLILLPKLTRGKFLSMKVTAKSSKPL